MTGMATTADVDNDLRDGLAPIGSGDCDALYVGNGMAVVSGVFVIGGLSDLLHDVRDWLSAVTEPS
jgi:hypothetical protein